MTVFEHRLLYLLPGPVPPAPDEHLDKFFHLSKILEGDVLLPVWWKSPEEAFAKLGPGSYPTFERGRFTYHLFLLHRFPAPFRSMAATWFMVARARQLWRSGKRFSAVMCYGTNRTGVAAVAIKWLTGARLISEVPGVPQDAYLFESPEVSAVAQWKKRAADLALRFVVRNSDRVKLLYPSQLEHYPALRRIPTSVFHDFVPVRAVDPAVPAEPYILTVGHPWYRKGVDLLIRAFLSIADQVPEISLRIVGYFPDRRPLENLVGGSKVEFLKPMGYNDTLHAISRCTVFVLASRSEAMGRVLLEAMAAGRPIVATAITGIPHYIEDGFNGLLFPSGDETALAEKLLQVLTDRVLRERLQQNALARVFRDFDEEAYVRNFRTMFHEILPSATLPVGSPPNGVLSSRDAAIGDERETQYSHDRVEPGGKRPR